MTTRALGLLSMVILACLSLSTGCARSATPGLSAGSSAAAGGSGGAGKAGSAGHSGAGGNLVVSGSGGAADDAGAADSGSNAADGGMPGSLAGTGGTGGTGGSGGSTGSAAAAGNASVDPALSDELFAQDRLPRFDITLPQASWDALTQDPITYVRGTLTYGDMTIEEVGVRIKGESSKRTLDQKAAFKIKFDEFVSKRTFFGLKRLTLNNMVSDPTFMAERLSYHLYRVANLPAPRCNHALVYVNGTFFGVYANVESEDKTFLSRWFSSNDGNLYEDGQVDLNDGNEQYFDRETNESVDDKRADLTALISAIDNASDETYLADLDGNLDTAHFLRFTAVEGAVNQWDGYSYTYFEPNNFRLYNDPTTNKFTFIPWGHDLSMKPYPVNPDDPEAAMYTRAYIPLFKVPLYENGKQGRDSGGKIFVRCLGSATCKQQYAAVVREIIALYDASDLATLAAQYYAQIKDHVHEDSRKEVTSQDFEDAYLKLLDHIHMRTSVMRDDLTAAGFTP